ncbi:MAG: hypothetical protein ACHP9Z_25540 [Streptosporangiales bacterium]
MDPDDAVFAVLDALGPDFVELAPDGEAHFDTAGTALLVAAAILGAVTDGVLAGIRESAKNGTTALIQAVTRQIRQRLSRERVKEPFTEVTSNEARDTALDATAAGLAEVQHAAAAVDPAALAQLTAASATAVRQALADLGLHRGAAERAGNAVSVQLSITLQLPGGEGQAAEKPPLTNKPG